jgi:hypothetical protein
VCHGRRSHVIPLTAADTSVGRSSRHFIRIPYNPERALCFKVERTSDNSIRNRIGIRLCLQTFDGNCCPHDKLGGDPNILGIDQIRTLTGRLARLGNFSLMAIGKPVQRDIGGFAQHNRRLQRHLLLTVSPSPNGVKMNIDRSGRASEPANPFDKLSQTPLKGRHLAGPGRDIVVRHHVATHPPNGCLIHCVSKDHPYSSTRSAPSNS